MTGNDPPSTSRDDADPDGARIVTLGWHLGYRVQAAIDWDPPGARAPDEFAVNVFVPNRDGDNVDVVRIDTAHAGCHVDRLYLPEGDRSRLRDYGVTVYSPEEAIGRFVVGRWREYLERYDENHGLPTRATQEVDEPVDDDSR